MPELNELSFLQRWYYLLGKFDGYDHVEHEEEDGTIVLKYSFDTFKCCPMVLCALQAMKEEHASTVQEATSEESKSPETDSSS